MVISQMNKLLNKFLETPETATDACVVHIPEGVQSKQQLLDLLKHGLRFPSYFGNNWDALDECITDLSWLSEKNVLIVHDRFPQLPEQDFNIYCDLLRWAIEDWKKQGTKTLMVTFG
jgi:RNAse (barnase) inhibitor barstar